MRFQQLTPPGIQSKSTDVLRIFLASFGPTQTLEEAKTEFIEAKTLRFCEHRLQHLLYLTVDQRQKYAEQLVLKGFLL